MAWVDLRNGILLCDSVAEEHPEVRLIELPPLMPINDDLGLDNSDGDDLMPCLDSIRDVTCANGWFRCIEVGFPQLSADNGAKQLDLQWTATLFKMTISSNECHWEPYATTNSVDISAADSYFPDLLLPDEIWYPKYNKLALSNVVSLYPTLDLYNNDMVYMVAKIKSTDPNGWVLAINTANNKLEKISPFSEESFHLRRIYLQCDFSKHLSMAPGAQLTQDLDKCTNRKKIELLEVNLSTALNQLRNIETHVKSLNRKYDGSVPFLFTGAASYLNRNIQKDAENGLNIDRGTNAVCDDCVRSMADLRLQLLASIDEIKSKVTVAHAVLCDLV